MPRGKTPATKTTKKTATAKRSRKATADKKTVKAAAAPAPAPAPVPASEPSTPTNTEFTSAFADQFERLSGLTQQLQDSFAVGKSFATEIRKLVSAITRFEKKAARTRGRRNTTGRKTQSGITRPVRISDELCNFLAEEKGTLLARTAVTKRITTYIRDQNLQNPENRKQIFPDVRLQSLLMPLIDADKKTGYTFFNLQRYLKHHYQKAEASTATASKTAGATA